MNLFKEHSFNVISYLINIKYVMILQVASVQYAHIGSIQPNHIECSVNEHMLMINSMLIKSHLRLSSNGQVLSAF